MNVVGHDDPRKLVIPSPMIKSEGRFNQPGNIRTTQMTFTATTVEVDFQFPAAFVVVFDLEQRFPFGT
jgi:hypothetical protein